jgi:hypothetical protein
MSDFAGTSAAAAHNGAARDKSGTDAFTDGNHEEVGVLAPGSIKPLGDRESIDVVLHKHRNAELAAQNRSKGNLPPAQKA